jgi:hypothetical protein
MNGLSGIRRIAAHSGADRASSVAAVAAAATPIRTAVR